MVKLPGFMFYPGDWMKDPALRSVSISARGLWTDMLCLMFESDRRGYLQHATGKVVTAEQLARMTGCSTDDVSRLLQELNDSGVSASTEHGVIYSRRMVRDERKRQLCSDAAKRGGGSPLLKTFKGISKGSPKGGLKGSPKGPPEYENEYERVLKKKGKASYEEVKAFCSELSIPVSDGEWFWNKCEGNGWTNGGKPIRDWRATIRSWKAAGYLPSQKSHSTGVKSAAEPEPETPGWRELKAEMESKLGQRRS